MNALTPQSHTKKNNKKIGLDFLESHTSDPTNPTLLNHSNLTNIYTFLLAGQFSGPLYFYFPFYHKHTNTPLSLPHTSPPVPHCLPSSPPSFFDKITEKVLRKL